jgi:hypothetical protein
MAKSPRQAQSPFLSYFIAAIVVLIIIGVFWISRWAGGLTADKVVTSMPTQEQPRATPDALLAAEPSTQTPSPTYTLTPTFTPSPTETAIPPTATPAPTDEPTPSFTPSPTETAIPPTATPLPTETAAPTTMLSPTHTPTPEPPTPTPEPGVNYLLPELQVLPPSVLYIEVYPETGVREIRFDTAVINMGDGPLIMHGSLDEAEGKTLVVQHLVREDGGQDQVEVGHFVYHPGHKHFHFESFSEMRLYSLGEDRSLDELITTTDKITSCVLDQNRLPSPPPNSPTTPAFPGCGQDFQGLSVGWVDVYVATLEGQERDITDVPDGRYALELWVNPDRLLIESNYDNNSVITLVEIEGTTITRLSD